ncbi:hypothetical protein BASA60_006658 [Batrachochytrium salamandrivorans]|nr:hypothetical protein BASA60_006658 [Batrachochytrium salamandrivorans]
MRFSTGIILSILLANVFAIEHPNDAHPSSLLARRAVVADADGVFLEKRNNDKKQKKPAKSKTSVPNLSSSQENLCRDDSDSDSNSIDGAERSSTDFRVYDPDQGRGATGGRRNIHTSIGPNQGMSSSADAPGDSSPQFFGHIRKKLPPVKLGFRLLSGRNRASVACERVWFRFGGKKGEEIGNKVYRMLEDALKTSLIYKGLCKDPAKSPFSVKLSSTTSDELKELYKELQKDVLKGTKDYVLAIETVINNIFIGPESVLPELENMMKKTYDFYEFIFNTKSRYSSLLKDLGISDNRRLERLEMYTKNVEMHEWDLSGQFQDINEMIEDYRNNPRQQGLSNSLCSTLEFKKRPRIKTKSAENRPLLEDVELEDPTSSND